MKIAHVTHVENVSEYRKNGNLFTPNENQKLLWAIFGLPENIEKEQKIFETVIDEIRYITQKELNFIYQAKLQSGEYKYIENPNEIFLK